MAIIRYELDMSIKKKQRMSNLNHKSRVTEFEKKILGQRLESDKTNPSSGKE